MNSSFTQLAIAGYISLHPSPHILENIDIPEYQPNNELHHELASLSEEAHDTYVTDEINTIENEIDQKVAELWGASEEELEDVQGSLAKLM